jgi:hypothetical protein
LEKRLSQDYARPSDLVQASIVTENSSVMAQAEFCSWVGRSRRGRALTVEEQEAEALALAPV